MKTKILTLAALATLGVCSCGSQKSGKMEITKAPFGEYEGQEVHLYTLSNGAGVTMKVATYGGTITELYTPDRDGKSGNITLGFPTLEDYRSEAYLKAGPYFGAIIGRYGNRIGQAKFTLDGTEYKLAANDGSNHLHGGVKGFDKVVWNAEELRGKDGVGLKLSYLSKDGDEGYPGNPNVEVIYFLTERNELMIRYLATTDKFTVCNLTNHAYFNLAAGAAPNALGHELTILADKFSEVAAGLIPTGKSLDVKDTPFDFTEPRTIGERIDANDAQLRIGGGYDHNWELNANRLYMRRSVRLGGYDHDWELSANNGELNLAAHVYEPVSGRTMEVFTTEPGVQFYAGNFLDGSLYGVDSVQYVKRYGFCLETQHFPDSPNQPSFPSTELKPGQTYSSGTVYKFGVKK